MKTRLTLVAIGSSLVLAAPALLAQSLLAQNQLLQSRSTNSVPLVQTMKYQDALQNDRSLGERALLPPGLKDKLRLTDEQKAELIPIEEDFAKTSKQYQIANQPRIDAAQDAIRQADISKDAGQIQAARKQLQQEWAGLQRYRDDSVRQIRPLLTPEQIVILDDPKNQWRANHGTEANDPSAN